MWWSKAAKNGWAVWLIPVHDNTPPCSRRRVKVCTAGVSETAANKLLAAGIARACAKQRQNRRTSRFRQPAMSMQPDNQINLVAKFVYLQQSFDSLALSYAN